MKKKNELILGIGHKVKSIHNPDKRVTILKEYALSHFPRTDVLQFALSVEAVTTKKKGNLILNVDGCIGKFLNNFFNLLCYLLLFLAKTPFFT
jgi:citrate synthase